jgi:CheY-like chemotaxis protein
MDMGQARPLRPMALVVEDDDDQRSLAAVLLEESEMDVVECCSAEAALAVMQNVGDRVAMVFTDISLAGKMDGVELAQVINAQRPKVAVLVTSGDPGDRLKDLPGHSAYIQKPWRALEVLEIAERARSTPSRSR